MRFDVAGNVDVPTGQPLARSHGTDLWIWPEGMGKGMCLVMTQGEWDRIALAVENARRVYATRGYTACEGINGD